MIIQCSACNTKFRLDDLKVKGKGVKVRCSKCQNVFIVTPPKPEEQVSPETLIPKTQQPQQTAAPSFDFSQEPPPPSSSQFQPPAPKQPETTAASFSSDDFLPKEEEKKEEPKSSWDIGGMDFSFEEKPKEEENKLEWDIGAPAAKEEPAASFSFDETPAPQPETEEESKFSFDIKEETTPSFDVGKKEEPEAETPFRFDFDEKTMPVGEKPSFEIEPPSVEQDAEPPAEQEDAKTVVMNAAPSIDEEAKEKPSEDLLGKAFDEIVEKEEAASAPKGSSRRVTALIAIAVVLLIIVGGMIYYFRMQATHISTTAQQKPMELAGLKGYYVDNIVAGRLFVVEGKLINKLDAEKNISGVHGILFDKEGKQVKDAWVAPGKSASQEELKVMPGAELESRFKDRNGIVPPNGSAPFMIVFQSIPDSLAEFSVEVNL